MYKTDEVYALEKQIWHLEGEIRRLEDIVFDLQKHIRCLEALYPTRKEGRKMEEKFYVWGTKCIPDELIRNASENERLNKLADIVARKYDECEWAVEVKIECEKLITIGINDDCILGHIKKSDIDTLNIARKHFTDNQWDLFVHTVNWADVEKAK